MPPFASSANKSRGKSYSATARGIPAIALSGSNKAVNYKDVNSTSHPAHVVAALSAKIVQGVIDSAGSSSSPLLPLGYGLNVNFPPLFAANWSSLPVVQTRMTGNSEVDVAAPGASPGTFTWGNIRPLAAGANACLSGDCGLPDETFVVGSGKVSMSLYIIDYSAPTNGFTKSLMQRFKQVTGC